MSITKALIALTQNRSWENITADNDPDNSKVVVYFDSGEIATHGHDPDNYKHTIYAVKRNTTGFRVCPGATSLSQVNSECTDGVLFSGPFPQNETVGTDSVTVGNIQIDGTNYWYASGLSGSGGEGEGENPIPDVGSAGVLIIILATGYLIYRHRHSLHPHA